MTLTLLISGFPMQTEWLEGFLPLHPGLAWKQEDTWSVDSLEPHQADVNTSCEPKKQGNQISVLVDLFLGEFC